MKTINISADVLRGFLVKIFSALGCDEQNATGIAEGVIEADLRGHRIQGTDHIYSIVADFKAGRLNGRARPRVARETAATAQIDGDGVEGHVGGRFACDIAIKKAKESGAASVGLVRAGDIFMVGAYVERIARAGLIGIACTNATPVRVHPPGGIDPMLGTNPIGFGFPTEGEPIIIDFSTSTSPVGHVRIASYNKGAIPPGIAIDREGRPTTDSIEALAGAFTPLGGHKGFALGLAVALLSGPMVGGVLGATLKEQMGKSSQIPDRGHWFMAIDPGAYGDTGTFRQRVSDHAHEIKSGRKAPGVAEILIPGERSLRQRKESLASGIEMLADVWKHTVEIARDLGIDPPTLR